ncbi:two-component system, OmpR family, phosphate regulon response regulator PhoB [Verrucomicrobium sp. GAS474]|uniref:response regulator n=1 Tax=Verrucomicrobium sp. GAS474 TaxID=1882831 RepID=UPI00087B7814|nr:response regulator transcription factor [Verrucomicrobium sp. GAS474]SDT86473.1 two-component system, OmpR family, phosphate regulon response regulator PhoB [Verrucomicrobium sp. GAS474]
MSSPSAKKILVVDDEADVLDLVCMNLRAAGYAVSAAENGAIALQKAKAEKPDLIVLDLMLPEMSGLEVCKALKKEDTTAAIPIIMVTAKTEEVDRIVGLELGADDYVAKPFSPRELVLRVKSVLRRGQEKPPEEEPLTLGDLFLDRSRHEVTVKGKAIELTATEFKLLAVLMERRGRVQGRERLLNDVWGYESVIDTRTVDTHVRRLREKLGRAASYIETIRGVGYRILGESAS